MHPIATQTGQDEQMSFEHSHNTSKLRRSDHERPALLAVPLMDSAAGHLVFVRGADRVTIAVEPALAALAEVAAEAILPEVALVGEELWVRQRRLSPAQRARLALLWGRATTTIRLTPSLPWRITARGGVSRLNADLRGLALSAFRVLGGARAVVLDLPRPRGVVPIEIQGGAADVALRRPSDVPVRLLVKTGGAQLALDDQHLSVASAGGELVAGDSHAPDRYEVIVAGGTSRLTVDSW